MAGDFYPGRRLSYLRGLCTIRYIGQVKDVEGDWLGVEWDDPTCGKHNGSRNGVKYFDCQSNNPTAGSFIRPSRIPYSPLSFLSALRKKYASRHSDVESLSKEEAEIRISGKTVQEIGFDKIRQQLATLHELRIVLLDGLCVAGIEARPWIRSQELQLQEWERISAQRLKIVQLSLSRNLIERWADVVGICSALEGLKSLNVSGNRFRDLTIPSFASWHDSFQGVKELNLDDTLLTWPEIVGLTNCFPALLALSASSNNLTNLTTSLCTPNLESLTLTSNSISTLTSLAPLTFLPSLATLILRSNPLIALFPLSPEKDIKPFIFPSLTTLDLTRTLLPSGASQLSILTPIPTIFPKLQELLISHTPLSATPSASLLTIARLATLTSLNFSPITPAERMNAELYYLNLIARELAAVSATEEDNVLTHHPRYTELCALHGAPSINRATPGSNRGEIKRGTMAERVVMFEFYMRTSDGETVTHKTEIPRTVDVYRIKGVVGRLFGIRPLGCRLIFESGELDPVAGGDGEDGGWSCSEDDEDSDSSLCALPDADDTRDGHEGLSNVKEEERDPQAQKKKKKGKKDREKEKSNLVKRETELTDGTKEVGFWIEGMEARVRVELR